MRGAKRGAGAATLAALAVALCGCGKYAEFTLPVLPGGEGDLRITFEEHPGPVLARGDMRDVLNPSVATNSIGVARQRINAYSAYDGKMWHTRVAQSEDGIRWTLLTPSLSPEAGTWEGSYIAANGSALYVDNEIWYWYEAGPRDHLSIGVAQNWQKMRRPVMEPGPYMGWDEIAVADPYVIRAGGAYYMYFLGQDRAARQRLGVARSRDGIQWEKLRTNPILEGGGPGSFDENLGEPAVWQARGSYWMLYTGRAANEVRKLGLARSTDGVHWTKLPVVISGAQEWDAKVICDPTVEPLDDSRVAVWFGGGNVARPDEGLNGQIGYGILRMEAK